MMPQKLNPDVAELARGKAGHGDRPAHRAARDGQGRCRSPTTATSQEDKPPVFAARRDVAARARARCAVLVDGLEFDRGRLAAAAADPLLLATDAAEALVAEGVPFRDAHEQVAA